MTKTAREQITFYSRHKQEAMERADSLGLDLTAYLNTLMAIDLQKFEPAALALFSAGVTPTARNGLPTVQKAS